MCVCRCLLGWLAAALSLGHPGLAGEAHGGRRTGSGERKPGGALRDAVHRYQVVIAPGWRPIEPPQGTLVAYQAPRGRATLAVTRIDVGTRRARDLAALIADVERGVERATPGFRRRSRKIGRSGVVGTLDLVYERDAPPGSPRRIVSRYLFFARYTVVLSIGLGPAAGRAERRAAESIARSFAPFQVP